MKKECQITNTIMTEEYRQIGERLLFSLQWDYYNLNWYQSIYRRFLWICNGLK